MHHATTRRDTRIADYSDPADDGDEGRTRVRFLFVGERPSHRAEQIGANWRNGKLAGKTLREALLALNLNPAAHHYLNLYPHARSLEDVVWEEATCCEIVRYAGRGYLIVGLGQIVSERLRANGIPHLSMIHPAARGAIRKTERYQAHVAMTLTMARKEARSGCSP